MERLIDKFLKIADVDARAPIGGVVLNMNVMCLSWTHHNFPENEFRCMSMDYGTEGDKVCH